MMIRRGRLGCFGLVLGTLAFGCGSGSSGGAIPEQVHSARAALSGTFTTIDVPGALSTACNGIYSDYIVGRFASADGNTYGFVREGSQFFGVQFEFGTNFNSVNGVSDDGGLAGTYDYNGGAGCLTPGSGSCNSFYCTTSPKGGCFPIGIGIPGSRDPVLLGTNRFGSTHVGAYTRSADGSVHGWRCAPGCSTFDPPDATLTFATGVATGAVVGRWDKDGVTHGYRRLGSGAFEPIDVPDAASTVAHGINQALAIVGEYVDQEGSTHGFVLEAGEFHTVDAPDAPSTVVKGISETGRMVGVYTDADGIEHGFLYTPD